LLKYCSIKELKKNLATGFTDFTEVKEKITTDVMGQLWVEGARLG